MIINWTGPKYIEHNNQHNYLGDLSVQSPTSVGLDSENYYRRHLNDVAGLAAPVPSGIVTVTEIIQLPPVEVTEFSDTFNRTSGTAIGPNWMASHWWLCGITNSSGYVRRSQAAIGAVAPNNGLILSNAGGTNPNKDGAIMFMCVPLMSVCWGVSQSVKVTLVEETFPTVGADSGLMTFCLPCGDEPTKVNFYLLQLFNGQYRLVRYNNNIVRTDLTVAAARTAVMPVTYELRSVLNAGDVTHTILENDIVLNTVIDNSANRLILGSPGLYAGETASGANSTKHSYINFTGRKL